jgi:hypothetical protein
MNTIYRGDLLDEEDTNDRMIQMVFIGTDRNEKEVTK